MPQHFESVVWLAGVLQIIWALFLLVLSFAVKRLVRDLDANTVATTKVAESLTSLNLALIANFVHKDDWIYIRERTHDLGDKVNQIIAREALRDQLDKRG